MRSRGPKRELKEIEAAGPPTESHHAMTNLRGVFAYPIRNRRSFGEVQHFARWSGRLRREFD
jgi:hypothetical protein